MNYVRQLPGNYSVDVVSHSMGSIVVGEALKEGMLVSHYAILHGAASASCYSTDSDPTIRSLAYGEAFKDISLSFPVNFFDENDFTVTWVWSANNEAFKPQTINSSQTLFHPNYYQYDPSYAASDRLNYNFYLDQYAHRSVTDFGEARAYVDYSLTGTIGGKDTSLLQGSLTGSVNDDYLGMNHSTEFNWSIQQLKQFYDTLLTTFGYTPNN